VFARVGWFWQLQLEYKLREWERRYHWYKKYKKSMGTAFPRVPAPLHPWWLNLLLTLRYSIIFCVKHHSGYRYGTNELCHCHPMYMICNMKLLVVKTGQFTTKCIGDRVIALKLQYHFGRTPFRMLSTSTYMVQRSYVEYWWMWNSKHSHATAEMVISSLQLHLHWIMILHMTSLVAACLMFQIESY